MKNKIISGSIVAAVCFLFTISNAKGSVVNGEEAFINSLDLPAAARLELPEPAQPSVQPYPQDAFSYLAECRIVDAQFAKRPTASEGVELLAGCMKQVSQRYRVTARAGVMVTPWGGPGNGPQGGTPSGIHITVSGDISNSQVMSHLAYSLQKRAGRLFGYSAVLSKAGVPAPVKAQDSWAKEAAKELRRELKQQGITAKVTVAAGPGQEPFLAVEFLSWEDYERIKDLFFQDPGDNPSYMDVKVSPRVPK